MAFAYDRRRRRPWPPPSFLRRPTPVAKLVARPAGRALRMAARCRRPDRPLIRARATRVLAGRARAGLAGAPAHRSSRSGRRTSRLRTRGGASGSCRRPARWERTATDCAGAGRDQARARWGVSTPGSRSIRSRPQTRTCRCARRAGAGPVARRADIRLASPAGRRRPNAASAVEPAPLAAAWPSGCGAGFRRASSWRTAARARRRRYRAQELATGFAAAVACARSKQAGSRRRRRRASFRLAAVPTSSSRSPNSELRKPGGGSGLRPRAGAIFVAPRPGAP